MWNEQIERRLWNARALARDCEFKKAYAALDRVLRMHPNELSVHDVYAWMLEDEVEFVGEVGKCATEKLRKARKHHHFVLKHSTNPRSIYVYSALRGLIRQARFLGKRRYELRLEQLTKNWYFSSELIEGDPLRTKTETVGG